MLKERAKQQTREDRILQLDGELAKAYQSIADTCDKLVEEVKDILKCLYGENSIIQCAWSLDSERPVISFYIRESNKYKFRVVYKADLVSLPGPEYTTLSEVLSKLFANIGISQCVIRGMYYDYYIHKDDVDELAKELQEILNSEAKE
jgi:hypothetical protein